MDDKRISDYFVVCGLPNELTPLDETSDVLSEDNKLNLNLQPLTDITVIFKSLGESLPHGDDWHCVEATPTGKLLTITSSSLGGFSHMLCCNTWMIPNFSLKRQFADCNN